MSSDSDPHRARVLNDCLPVLGIEITNASCSIDVNHEGEQCETYELLPSGVAAQRVLTVQSFQRVDVETIEGVELVAGRGSDTCTEFSVVCFEHAEAFDTMVNVDKSTPYKLFGYVWEDENEEMFFNVQRMEAVSEADRWNYLVNTAGIVAARAERLHRYRSNGVGEADVLRGGQGVSNVEVNVLERVDDVYNIPCEEFVQTANTIVDNVDRKAESMLHAGVNS